MSKRPPVDLDSIIGTATATPMREGMQRQPAPAQRKTATADLEPLSFKVDPAFRKRFKTAALHADLSLVDLLKQALDTWEGKS